jgi:hypothetical protein
MVASIEQALSPVTRILKHRANELLDLREAALARKDPGKCLHCYFQLRNSRHSKLDEVMTPLKTWLENHLEIIAKGPESDELERIAVNLDWNDIDHYCENLVEDFRKNHLSSYRSKIELVFQFKPLAAMA